MRNVVIGFLGTILDQGRRRSWRPSVQICAHPDFPVDRLELLHDHLNLRLAEKVARDITALSPRTEVRLVDMELKNPWDFQEVYGKLYDFAESYGFDEDREHYYVHLTTGTHVAQICWFLLTESRHIPARLLQSGPPEGKAAPDGTIDIIDLDLARYNALQRRFETAAREHSYMLRGGIPTRNAAFHNVIERLEQVVTRSDEPILLVGEAGVGKTTLAQRIHELKLQRRRVKGRLVHVNCAGLQGQHAMAALFGQRRNVVGLAGTERAGFLSEAEGGVLFLDDIDLLPHAEQALLLDALERGSYYPVGSDTAQSCRFHLIATTSRDLSVLSQQGILRPDLLARLALWVFHLPPLRERREDMEVELAYELEKAERSLGCKIGFNVDARARYLRFARDPAMPWSGNYRDLSASARRLCTLAERGRITLPMVEAEILALTQQWAAMRRDGDMALLAEVLPDPTNVDEFDRAQLAAVVRACRESSSLSAAGRRLFALSRKEKTSQNDADRLRKYLGRFGLNWEMVSSGT
ncbi:transcriptional regulator [Komagataeibacter saccharivorans]|uniref:RNA repair transcriptional activator RtcR family protein n=1 Tax=Komagataeibacter saccharivorans TaxID=265959 RepID=UPI000D7C908A|nr:RNA repair transcriptional activator RtcR family protein [Komagataeibacter saccharivorans]PYD52234.1 transcriptional regulator [Komagataeibacter saccharivorans]GBQ36357.1 sigma-54 dependent transcriptional regulator [Komagataeibacter saccharivorans NRIC 0614]